MKLKITNRMFDIITGITLATTFIMSLSIVNKLMSYSVILGYASFIWFALWILSILMVSYGNIRVLNLEEENKNGGDKNG